MKRNENLTAKQKVKLEFIELLAYFYGFVNREDIIKKFNMSAASATNMLSEYNQNSSTQSRLQYTPQKL